MLEPETAQAGASRIARPSQIPRALDTSRPQYFGPGGTPLDQGELEALRRLHEERDRAALQLLRAQQSEAHDRVVNATSRAERYQACLDLVALGPDTPSDTPSEEGSRGPRRRA